MNSLEKMKIDILMSVYIGDELDWVKECIVSTLDSIKENLNNFIVVIDGPINNQILKYLKGHKKIKLIKLKKNRGLAYALNYGLKYCSAKYVARIDADDICLKTRFKKQLNILKNNNCDIISSSVIEFDNITEYKKMRYNYNFYIVNNINHPTVIYDRNKILNLGGYRNIKFFEDYDLWLRASKKNLLFINLKDFLVKMRFNKNSLKRRNGFKYLLFELKALNIFFFKDRLIPFRFLPFWIIRLFLRIIPINLFSKLRKIL